MADFDIQIRCQRCGDQMNMVDPAPGRPWAPQQFWTCARCGRHFWTSYVADPAKAVPKQQPPPVTPGATTPAPTAQAPAATTPTP